MTTATRRPVVVLVHGLWMTRHVMGVLGLRLRATGCDVTAITYRSVRRPLDANADQICRLLATLDAPCVRIVAHSYGGIVALRALARRPDPRVDRVVLLGSPVRGSIAGARLVADRRWQRIFGESAAVWRDGPKVAVPPGVAVGAIAGTRPVGLGRIVTRLAEANDGVVCVDETRLEGLADHRVLEVGHSTMLASGAVARQVEHFLREGRFAP
jgi:pimeloyl-ACP methyl ester carboxylesterase